MKRRLDLAMTLVGRPAADLPRRADHRTRPAQPPRPVADRAGAARRRRDDPPHHAVPRGGRPAAHTVGLLDGGRLVATGTPAELKAQAGGETLDDVFLALTGHRGAPRTDSTETHDEHLTVRRPRLGHDAAAQPQAPGPLPLADVDVIGMPVVFLLLFVYVFGGTMGAGLPGGTVCRDRAPTTSTTSRRRSWS